MCTTCSIHTSKSTANEHKSTHALFLFASRGHDSKQPLDASCQHSFPFSLTKTNTSTNTKAKKNAKAKAKKNTKTSQTSADTRTNIDSHTNTNTNTNTDKKGNMSKTLLYVIISIA